MDFGVKGIIFPHACSVFFSCFILFPLFLFSSFECWASCVSLAVRTEVFSGKHHPKSSYPYSCFSSVVQITLFVPPPFLSLYPRIHGHSHLHARKSSLVAESGEQPSEPSIPHRPRRSRLWSSTLLLRFGQSFSRLSATACLLSSSTASAAWTSICWCRGSESHASPPSQRHHPCPYPQRRCRWRLCLRELPRWMGLPWAVKGLVLMTGLVLPVMALGLGLSWSPGPFTLMNASCQFPLLKWPMLTSS